MTEIVDELRATRPRASDALRLQVLTVASRPPARQPSFLDRVRGRRLALLVPAAAGLAVVVGRRDRRHATAAVRQGRLVRRGHGRALHRRVRHRSRRAARRRRRVRRAEGSARPVDRPCSALRRHARAGGRGHRRALRGNAACALDRTGPRRLRRLRAVRHGRRRHVVRHAPRPVEPGRRRGHSALGARHDRRAERPDPGSPGVARRPRPREREASRADRRADRPDRAGDDVGRARATARAARTGAGAAPRDPREPCGHGRRGSERDDPARAPNRGGERCVAPGSRLDRALDRALEVLAWEAVVALAFAVAAAPLVLVGAAVWTTRTRRRREDEELLAAS